MPTRESIVVAATLAVIFEINYLAAFFIRGELLLKASESRLIVSTIGWVVGIKVLVFFWRGFCHRPWRAARFEDLNRLLRTSTTVLLVLVACNYFLNNFPGWMPIPRSVLLLDWCFTVLGVGGMQAFARSLYEELMPMTAAGSRRSILVIDASEAGRDLVLALPQIPRADYFVAGLLDDDADRYGLRVGHARVLGPVSMAPACAERLRVSEVIVLDGSVYGARLRALCDACAAINVRVRIADHQGTELASAGKAGLTIKPIRVRDIELHDLLSRPHARLDDHDPHVAPFVADRCVLVTGAGSAIGAEICRQLLRFQPAKLVLVEHSEDGLFAIDRELAAHESADRIEIVPVLAEVANSERCAALLAEHKPAIVIHAAQFKHVSLMESHPVEAIEKNTLATAAFAEVAAHHGVECFVALSTVKAVYPSSIMGASKLVTERFLEALSQSSPMKIVTVRYGNVLGVSGSVVPIFMEQLSRGQPLTVSHPGSRRYFLTLDEAAQFVLLAAAISDRGGIYVLEMGSPLSIVDLAASVAFVKNVPPSAVRIEYGGLRPGDKLEEELFFTDETHEPTVSPFIWKATRPPRTLTEVRRWLATLRESIAQGPQAAAKKVMQIAAHESAGVCTSVADRSADPEAIASP